MNGNLLAPFLRLFPAGTEDIVCFDLEWNQNSYAPSLRMPHEIIEIGACRLAPDGQITASFSELVRPKLYRRLDKHIRQVTGITEQELSSGRPFEAVAEDFAAFCGDAGLVTWGRDDYPVLSRNLAFYQLPQRFAPPVDAQLVYGFACLRDPHRQVNLHAALELAGIAVDVPAHRAVYDAECAAAMLGAVSAGLTALDAEERGALTELLDREARIAAARHVSRVTRHTLHTDALRDDAVTTMLCPVCGRPLALTVPWFDAGRERYAAVGLCRDHGLSEGQMHLRKGAQGTLTAHQRVHPATAKEAEAIEAAHRLFLETPPARRHHRLSMEEVRGERKKNEKKG